MSETVGVTLGLHVPKPPNYLRVVGMSASVDVAEIDVNELRKVGAAWTEALIENARQRANIQAGDRVP